MDGELREGAMSDWNSADQARQLQNDLQKAKTVHKQLSSIDTSDGSPMDTSYADGTPIADETLAAIRAAYWANSVAIPLRTGDLVVVDNMLASHGRMSWIPVRIRRAPSGEGTSKASAVEICSRRLACEKSQRKSSSTKAAQSRPVMSESR